jgi:hypothetical protein
MWSKDSAALRYETTLCTITTRPFADGLKPQRRSNYVFHCVFKVSSAALLHIVGTAIFDVMHHHCFVVHAHLG